MYNARKRKILTQDEVLDLAFGVLEKQEKKKFKLKYWAVYGKVDK